MLIILNIYLYLKSHIQIRYWKCIINPFHVVLCVILQLEENWQIASSFELPGMRRNQCKLALCSDRLKAARDNDYFVDRTLFSSLLSCRFPPYCLSLSFPFNLSLAPSLTFFLALSKSLLHVYSTHYSYMLPTKLQMDFDETNSSEKIRLKIIYVALQLYVIWMQFSRRRWHCCEWDEGKNSN